MSLEKLKNIVKEDLQQHVGENPINKDIEKIYIDGNHIVIKHRSGFDYDILLSRIDTHKQIVGWVSHLNEKNWFTKDVLSCFLKVLNTHFDGIIDKSR